MTFQHKLKSIIEEFKLNFKDAFIFSPTENEDTILFFEKKYGIRLPEDFRWFLLNIGNGILKRNQWDFNLIGHTDFTNFHFYDNHYNPSVPFDLTMKVCFTEISENDNYPFEIIVDNDDKIFETGGFESGRISIVSYQGGTEVFLVVNGKEFGNVWVEDIPSNDEIYPEYDIENNKKRLTFTEWLQKNIQERIRQKNELESSKQG